MDVLDSISSIYSWDNDPWDLYPGHDTIHAVDMWKDTTGAAHCTSKKLALSSEIDSWLRQSAAPSSEQPVATMKLLFLALSDEATGKVESVGLQKKKASMREVMSSFSIPEAALAHTVSWVPGFVKFPAASQQSDLTGYGIFQMQQNIAWSHTAGQSATKGIVWYEERAVPFSRALIDLDKLKDFIDQPMFPGLLNCVMIIRRLSVERRPILKSVQQAELQVGTEKGYEYLGGNPWAGTAPNYAELSSVVAEALVSKTDLCLRLSAAIQYITQVIEQNSQLSHTTSAQSTQPSRDRLEAMNDMLKLVRNHADQLLAHANAMQERMDVQMNRVRFPQRSGAQNADTA